ncbi:hypothetical protein NU08_4507 [Flavobacterium anhuiense]|uniref:Uncharacterized protein n=1 Tax=Flavobacterium anhuiense TaxID=459526 RepID=A0A444VS51_9FLAO|nr:hypothetical protein [Flavobacterium anhuiense]RYJ36441.1 hypothetical protein NU08_4507 [Flavobacterium anhuiense]
MKKLQFLFIVFLLPFLLLSQNKISKSEVQKIIKESQIQKKNGRISLPSIKSWKFNNTDSLYFKSDTLIAIQNKTNTQNDFCEFIDWTFYRKNAFILGNTSYCEEPHSRLVTKYPEDYFYIAVYQIENRTMIDMLRNDKMIVDSFNVIEIENNDEFLKIKLVRRFIPLPYNNKI